MGIVRALKAKIVERSVKKNKTNYPFDIQTADKYQLPADAESKHSNSHYFIFTDFKTGETVFLRSAVRGGNDTDEYWLTYKDKEGQIWLAEEDHTPKGGNYPVKIDCITPGKTLRFSYEGNVIPAEKGPDGMAPVKGAKPVKLVLNAEFMGTGNPFEFSFHMSPKTMARAVSYEKFNKSFRDTMKAIHQVHYEQAGRVSATIDLDGKETTFKDLPSVRDHSFGRRDWNYFDRYIWTIAILENGDFIHTSLMRYPALSHLQAGFYESGAVTKSLYYCTPMDELPTTGSTPEQMEFFVQYEDGKRRNVKVKEDFRVPYYFDDDYKVVEGVYEYDVDGVRGRGIVEFAFNKDRSRWTRNK